MSKLYVIVNLYNEKLSSYPDPMTKAEAEKVCADEWKKGWEVYMKEQG